MQADLESTLATRPFSHALQHPPDALNFFPGMRADLRWVFVPTHLLAAQFGWKLSQLVR